MNSDSSAFPLSIGSRCINRDWFGMPMSEVWAIMEENLHFIHHAFKIRIHLFVLMSNHFHLMASAPEANMPAAMQYLLAQSSRQIAKPMGRINHTWRAKYFRSLIGNPRYYLHAYKYFYRNPVEADICERVERYPYSTLHGLIGQSRLLIPVERDDTLFSDVEGTLEWLNKTPKADHREAVRKALRRRRFKLPRNESSKQFHALETESY